MQAGPVENLTTKPVVCKISTDEHFAVLIKLRRIAEIAVALGGGKRKTRHATEEA